VKKRCFLPKKGSKNTLKKRKKKKMLKNTFTSRYGGQKTSKKRCFFNNLKKKTVKKSNFCKKRQKTRFLHDMGGKKAKKTLFFSCFLAKKRKSSKIFFSSGKVKHCLFSLFRPFWTFFDVFSSLIKALRSEEHTS